MKRTRFLVLLTLIAGLSSFNSTCDKTSSPNEWDRDRLFRIYITAEPAGDPLPSLDEMELLDEPFLTTDDIASYEYHTHTIHFSETVHDRLKEWGNLNLRTFVVTVMGDPVYWGKFMCDLNSQICQNPIIKLDMTNLGNVAPETIIIERAYPQYFGSPTDPDIRDNVRVFEALRQAGILLP